jgi:hypothetical protein
MEAHVVVPPDIKSLEQLHGQKVNRDELGSGTNSSKRLGIKIEDPKPGFGESQSERNCSNGAGCGQANPIDVAAEVLRWPFARFRTRQPLGNDFLPAVSIDDDYPEPVAEGGPIDTVADGAVLISYNWSKYTDYCRRAQTFVNAFFLAR